MPKINDVKIIAIGDIHGRDIWKDIVGSQTFDKVIFMGDYFDSKTNIHPLAEQNNFRDIVAFKKANSDRVVLLFGNHDYHYLRTVYETYSNFQELQKVYIEQLLDDAISAHLIQMCFLHDKFLFSHAGITKTWLHSHGFSPGTNSIESYVNYLFKFKPKSFAFQPGTNASGKGNDITQSPIWVRLPSLLADGVDFTQVVGHTQQDTITQVDDKVILIDALENGEYLVIDAGKIIVQSVQ